MIRTPAAPYLRTTRLAAGTQDMQTRNFTHNNIGRRPSETHPESGTTTYTMTETETSSPVPTPVAWSDGREMILLMRQVTAG